MELFSPAVLLVLVVVLLLGTLALWGRRRRVDPLERAARADYEAARGTAHLELLRAAQTRLDETLRDLSARVDQLTREMATLEAERDAQLEAAIVAELLQRHLDEVPGIGPTLQRRIRHEVFRGRLDDLRQAYRLPGVGPQRQQALDGWVEQWRAQLPALKAQPSPAQQKIETTYRNSRETIAQQLEGLSKRRATLERQRVPIVRAIEQLERVRVQDFVAALRDSQPDSDEVTAYLRGVYAEWEAAPDWFEVARTLARP